MSSSEVKSLQGRKAAAIRWSKPDAQNVARDLAAAKIEQYIERVVADAPPLTGAQRSKLAALLTGGAETRTVRRPVTVDQALADAPDHIALTADTTVGGETA